MVSLIRCYKCKRRKSIKHFNYRQNNQRSKLCNLCSSKYWKQYYIKTKEHHKDGYRIRVYGIDSKQVETLRLQQFNLCAICRQQFDTINIDHDHKTSKVRGLLCSNCNRGLGMFKDDIKLLKFARIYLVKHAR